jgi:PKD repeat protein
MARHTYSKAGKYKVKEVVHTDNLDEPLLTEQTFEINVHEEGPIATFAVSPEAPEAGQAFTLDGSASHDPKGSKIVKWSWTIEGGSPIVTSEPTLKQTLPKGSYTIALTVTAERGATSEPTSQLVIVGESTQERHEREAKEAEAQQHAKEAAEAQQHAKEAAEAQQHAKEAAEAQQHAKEERERQEREQQEVASYKVSVASSAITVSKAGVATLKVSCAGTSSCSGTITLQTASAVSASRHRSILTLASASFSAISGHTMSVTLRLSPKARKLLSKDHTLRAKVTIASHDARGRGHTVTAMLTLKAGKH